MIEIPLSCQPFVEMDRLVGYTNQLTIVRRHADEASALPAEFASPGLAEYLTAEAEAIAKRLAELEAALPSLEKVATAHFEAREALAEARGALEVGTLDAKKALKLRDEVEVAEARARVRFAELRQAQASLPSLPTAGSTSPALGVEYQEARGVAEAIMNVTTNRHFAVPGRGQFDFDKWRRWLALPNDVVRLIPFILERYAKQSDTAFAENTEEEILRKGLTQHAPRGELATVWADFVRSRENYRSERLQNARAQLERIQEEVQR